MANIHGTKGKDNLSGIGAADDWIFGYGGFDTLAGGYGDDWLFGHEGNDLLLGQWGKDRLYGGDGKDRLYGGSGNDALLGQGGDDTLIGGPGADSLNGGSGFDYADYSLSSAGVFVSLLGVGYTGDAAGDTLVSIEGLIGSNHNDTLSGNHGDNTIDGGLGDDDIKGHLGDDVIIGSGGFDNIDGGGGEDTLDYSKGTFHTTTTEYKGIYADLAEAYVAVGDGDYLISLKVVRIEHLIGTPEFDSVRGTDTNNTLRGMDGNDELFGRGGDDRLEGGRGQDDLYGQAGADTLSGGMGRDVVTGGAGDDAFLFAENESGSNPVDCDVITDYTQSEDWIDLSNIDADQTLAGDQAFSFIGSGAFTGAAGELRFVQSAGNTVLYGDMDGDAAAEFGLELTGIVNLSAGEFVL